MIPRIVPVGEGSPVRVGVKMAEKAAARKAAERAAGKAARNARQAARVHRPGSPTFRRAVSAPAPVRKMHRPGSFRNVKKKPRIVRPISPSGYGASIMHGFGTGKIKPVSPVSNIKRLNTSSRPDIVRKNQVVAKKVRSNMMRKVGYAAAIGGTGFAMSNAVRKRNGATASPSQSMYMY